jgi:HAD superfamily hydrolase (TIGR01459 family)
MPAIPPSIPILPSIAGLAAESEAWISDIWGVLHDGVKAFPAAGDACVRFRESGGAIILVTNAPRPASDVAAMLQSLDIPRAAYDAIVTSGDVTRSLIEPWQGRGIFHLGPDRQLSIFDGLDARLVSPEVADVVVCTGLVEDEHETPDDYRDLLRMLAGRRLDLICANPDLVVERGARLVYCAGALAQAYAALGGTVRYAGKPHAPIYERAFAALADIRGHTVSRSGILAIGDGVLTDIAGAAAMGLKSVFIASALHIAAGHALDTVALKSLFETHPAPPVAAMTALRW